MKRVQRYIFSLIGWGSMVLCISVYWLYSKHTPAGLILKEMKMFRPKNDIHCITLLEDIKRDSERNYIIPNDEILRTLPLHISNCLFQRYVTTIQTHCAKHSHHGSVQYDWTLCIDGCNKPDKRTILSIVSMRDGYGNAKRIAIEYNTIIYQFHPSKLMDEKFKEEIPNKSNYRKIPWTFHAMEEFLSRSKVYNGCRKPNGATGHEHYRITDPLVFAHQSPNQIEEFLCRRYLTSTQTLCKEIVHLGGVRDGGWDVCNDIDYRPNNPCLVYSFGINWDFGFDDDIADTYGCEVHSFDPSMRLKNYKRKDNVFFHKIGISDKSNYFDDKRKWNLSTLGQIRKSLHHEQVTIDILKLDIESDEWKVLDDIIISGEHEKITQLLVEFHYPANFERLNTIHSLYLVGFRIFWYHRNAYCRRNRPYIEFAGCIEVGFVKER